MLLFQVSQPFASAMDVFRQLKTPLLNLCRQSNIIPGKPAHFSPTPSDVKEATPLPLSDLEENRIAQEFADLYHGCDISSAKLSLRSFSVTAKFVKEQLHKMEKYQSLLTHACLSYGQSISTQGTSLSDNTAISSTFSDTYVETFLERPQILNADDFVILLPLGGGASGTVYKVQHKATGRISAMKIIPNAQLSARQIKAVCAEQQALKRALGVTGVLQLEASFQDTLNFYLLTTYHSGGDLASHMTRFGCFTEDQIRVYGGELIIAIQRLHELGIVHRDLKPANILIDSSGHIVIADFGLAHVFDDMPFKPGVLLNHPCGTPGFMAPEVFQRDIYAFGADVWSLGIILFIMAFGFPPWVGASPQEIFLKTLAEPLYVAEPDRISSEFHEVLHLTLAKNPQDRVSLQDLKSGRFFGNLDWSTLLSRHTPAPPKSARDPGPPPRPVDLKRVIDVGRAYDAPGLFDPFPLYAYTDPALLLPRFQTTAAASASGGTVRTAPSGWKASNIFLALHRRVSRSQLPSPCPRQLPTPRHHDISPTGELEPDHRYHTVRFTLSLRRSLASSLSSTSCHKTHMNPSTTGIAVSPVTSPCQVISAPPRKVKVRFRLPDWGRPLRRKQMERQIF